MSLQALWSLYQAHPHQAVNSLALFFAVIGSWLLMATRLREQRASARLVVESDLEELEQDAPVDERSQKINRFFYTFGSFTLAVALGVSWASTQL